MERLLWTGLILILLTIIRYEHLVFPLWHPFIIFFSLHNKKGARKSVFRRHWYLFYQNITSDNTIIQTCDSGNHFLPLCAYVHFTKNFKMKFNLNRGCKKWWVIWGLSSESESDGWFKPIRKYTESIQQQNNQI